MAKAKTAPADSGNKVATSPTDSVQPETAKDTKVEAPTTGTANEQVPTEGEDTQTKDRASAPESTDGTNAVKEVGAEGKIDVSGAPSIPYPERAEATRKARADAAKVEAEEQAVRDGVEAEVRRRKEEEADTK